MFLVYTWAKGRKNTICCGTCAPKCCNRIIRRERLGEEDKVAIGFSPESGPKFSQPVRQIVFMLIICMLTVVIGYLLLPTVGPVFQASPYFNGFIIAVFIIGVLACFMQVFSLINSVSWIEGFAMDRPGHEFVQAPSLLASLAALLSDTRARRALTSTSTRSILDSVAQRIEEARDITRYIVNFLIFLGLLGTFYGLATTVPAVVDTIRALAPEDGSDQVINFQLLMSGLEDQLGGMGTAFASSLLGLAGSLVVGLLELFAGHGQNRFYTELEDWLSSITRIGFSSGDADGPQTGSSIVAGIMEQNALQIEQLKDVMQRAEERRTETDKKLASLVEAVSSMTHHMGEARPGARAADEAATQERIAAGQERLVAVLSERAEADGGVLDAETRMRLRNIDVQLLRILEEMAAGRQDSVSEIRAELSALSDTIRDIGGRS